MIALQILFWVVVVGSWLAAIMVVTRKNLVHAALFLVITFFGVAVLFVLLEAGYWAVIQVLVYIGAIAIMMIFAVMLTRDVTSEESAAFSPNYGWAAVVAAIVLAGLVVLTSGWSSYAATAPEADAEVSAAVTELGVAFFSIDGYVIPTLVASILLLAGMIGALMVAWPGKSKAREE
jgi:NADH-quinone oxidoreductase subunit J